MKIQLGFSTCPNDTFIFDALVHHRIDTEGLEWEVHLADVEQLNQWASEGRLDVTKLSYHALAHHLDKYALLYSGSALGRGCGPLLIAKDAGAWAAIQAGDYRRIAVPGLFTTAYFLLRCALPALDTHRVQPMVFSAIEDAILNGQADAGLIIHENRFTYQQRGLVQLLDLGRWWETTTGFPIPLGGIAVHRRWGGDIPARIDRVLRRSIAYAFEQPDAVMPYVRQHAQAMEDAVMRQHIALYVNHFTLDLGQEGRQAIEHLMATAARQGMISLPNDSLFVAPNTGVS